MEIYSKQLREGVFLSACKTDKFKSALMTVSFAVPLHKSTASGYSLLTNLVSLCTGKYPSMQSFSIIKDELYALGLDSYVQRRGETLLVRFEINAIADSFAFDNERVLFRATELLGDAIFNPYLENGAFPHSSVETEKICLIEEISSIVENKPAYAMLRARQILCEGEPFATDAAGDIDAVKALNGSALMPFYRNILENAPVFITYAGEADGKYVEECINANMPFTPRELTLPEPIVHIKRDNILRVTENMDMEQSVLVLGLTLDKIPESAFSRAVLTVFDEIFGGSPASKLFMNVREREGLCYYCSSHPSGRKNVMFVSCGLEPGMESVAVDAIYRELNAMKNGDFTESDIENAKMSITRSLLGTESNLGSISGYLLSRMVSKENLSIEETIKTVSSVTKDDVVRFASTVSPELEYILAPEALQ